MNDQQKAPAARNGSGLGTASQGNSSAAQRQRLLARLREGPITTLDARRSLDILMPAARVFELRAMGYRIDTYRAQQATECGKRHCVARYALQLAPAVPSQHSEALDKCGRHSGASDEVG